MLIIDGPFKTFRRKCTESIYDTKGTDDTKGKYDTE